MKPPNEELTVTCLAMLSREKKIAVARRDKRYFITLDVVLDALEDLYQRADGEMKQPITRLER